MGKRWMLYVITVLLSDADPSVLPSGEKLSPIDRRSQYCGEGDSDELRGPMRRSAEALSKGETQPEAKALSYAGG
jgi:hypothetical protein